jgi:NAD+ kinase
MMRIAIYGRSFQDNFTPGIQYLFEKLKQLNGEIYIFEAFHSFLKPRVDLSSDVKIFHKHHEIKGKVDFLISIGGDGSLLDTVTLIRDSKIPILGINTGRLGFLSNISIQEIDQAMDALHSKKYKVDERALLKVKTEDNLFGETNFALNELTIHKKDSSSMITIHAYINDQYLNSYWADGLIIATPTGSTAYSLSCAGPIVVPGSENFVITPIAPHNLNVRPIVVSDNSEIKLKIEGRGMQFLASLDSRSETIDSKYELTIVKEKFKIGLIQLENQDFLRTIRNKLMWGIDKRN